MTVCRSSCRRRVTGRGTMAPTRPPTPRLKNREPEELDWMPPHCLATLPLPTLIAPVFLWFLDSFVEFTVVFSTAIIGANFPSLMSRFSENRPRGCPERPLRCLNGSMDEERSETRPRCDCEIPSAARTFLFSLLGSLQPEQAKCKCAWPIGGRRLGSQRHSYRIGSCGRAGQLRASAGEGHADLVVGRQEEVAVVPLSPICHLCHQ